LREMLLQSNTDLLRDIEHLRLALQDQEDTIPLELEAYYDWVITQLNDFRQLVTQNIWDLNSGINEILPEILSKTQSAAQWLSLFNRRLVSAILRTRPADRLCLKLLHWLHSVHTNTRAIPLALSDGDFASWLAPPLPTIYFMPPSAQQGLLYLPLFFHEFGHLLYAFHRDEMDDLIRDLQAAISELLTPSTHRDDSYAQRESEQRSVIVETWYSWAQELFCDAVGLVVGGPAFAHAFSMYLQMLGRGQYHLPADQLIHRDHPVTWLRVQFVVARARRLGFEVDAAVLEDSWKTIASAMGVVEDYYGFYIPQFVDTIDRTIDDLLIEAEPRKFADEEVSGLDSDPSADCPVRLLNQAWYQFRRDVETYPTWESEAIKAFLNADLQNH
jgi:hypothetical protein